MLAALPLFNPALLPPESMYMSPVVSVMSRYGDLFHIWTFTVHRTISSPS